MHRFTKADVRAAFVRYQTLTGDTGARLFVWNPRDGLGNRYEITGAAVTLYFHNRKMLAGEAAYRTISAFCAGYEAAAKAPPAEVPF
jgi:hypothetical protein